MVDFSKRLGKRVIPKKTNPIHIYESLDRASDKGPLRPIQKSILEDWYSDHRDKKDVILKLHTGQGKTLIGLLILQSYLNELGEPVVYLCPNNYLVQQTCEQAKSFGINFTTADDNLPDDFREGRKILITSCQKMFNGKTKFGIGASAIKVSTILMDDAHSCIDIIKDSCKIKIDMKHKAYTELVHLFSEELKEQGIGTFTDIKNNDYNAFLPVPYWAWNDKYSDVTSILSKYREDDCIKYTWPILKNRIQHCHCIVSGQGIEIYPYIIPYEEYRSYNKATHRIFMSATLSDDSFFIKDLGIDSDVIKNPLRIKSEKWSGEKMILFPSCIADELNQSVVAQYLCNNEEKRDYGVVALLPTFKRAKYWENYGAVVSGPNNIYRLVENLKNGKYEKTVVIANRYDGIDLPDKSCRILAVDSKPFAESLEDKYVESCIPESNIIAKRIAQKIEQGFGRAVRGEKDYCAILITGDDLVQFCKSSRTRKYFSKQTQMQINIGTEITAFAIEDMIKDGQTGHSAFVGLINQLITRDENWKSFYEENMDLIETEEADSKLLSMFEKERSAELAYLAGNGEKAIKIIQNLIDNDINNNEELRGWYLQEIARYKNLDDSFKSVEFQIAAHKKNPYLLKPKTGMEVSKIDKINLRRMENISKWISRFENYEELLIEVNDILTRLSFGADSDKFEEAFHHLGQALGFICQRPDKEWKEGPDNLWKIKKNFYLLTECKNQVDADRKEITKTETGQMNNSCVWFNENYQDAEYESVIIISTNKLAKGAGFNSNVKVIRPRKLDLLKTSVRKLFIALKGYDINNLTEIKLSELIKSNNLTEDDLISKYTESTWQ